ncbi:hypothetical protein [Curtobacterium sp. 458]|uniref:hypothetical protein n=1 Tax=Curtobacterium sp. 458 TaxID=3050069 RepID=UPI0025B2931D|nr:hypothetical protein [Curtobacterium sp. 458]WJY01419.1 hypothetical protein QPJ90_06875 [Curtobacterium sp. 458]
MGDDRTLTEPVLRARPEPSQLTKDARWMVLIVLLALVVQHFGATWSTGFSHAGTQTTITSSPWVAWTLTTIGFAVVGSVVAIARRGAVRFDEHTVMGLALAGVVGTTVLVWLLIPVEMTWVQWAVEHGDPHPFVFGNVHVVSRYADYTG